MCRMWIGNSVRFSSIKFVDHPKLLMFFTCCIPLLVKLEFWQGKATPTGILVSGPPPAYCVASLLLYYWIPRDIFGLPLFQQHTNARAQSKMDHAGECIYLLFFNQSFWLLTRNRNTSWSGLMMGHLSRLFQRCWKLLPWKLVYTLSM